MAKKSKASTQGSSSSDLAAAMSESRSQSPTYTESYTGDSYSANNNGGQNSKYSFPAFLEFISSNFTILFLIILFFMAGFFSGSMWQENKSLKGGRGTSPTAAAQPSAAGAEATNLSIPNLIALAGSLGADEGKVEACITSGEKAKEIADEMAGGSAAGVNGTPGTIIVVNGVPSEIIPGALPYEQVKPLIDKYVNGGAAVSDPALASMPAVGAEDHITGNKNAKIVLVEYSDYECTFCKQFHPTMMQVMEEYGNDVAWVLRDYPLPFHPSAQKAAEAAECVADIGGEEAFWEFSHAIFE